MNFKEYFWVACILTLILILYIIYLHSSYHKAFQHYQDLKNTTDVYLRANKQCQDFINEIYEKTRGEIDLSTDERNKIYDICFKRKVFTESGVIK